jgi:hypothetical protein
VYIPGARRSTNRIDGLSVVSDDAHNPHVLSPGYDVDNERFPTTTEINFPSHQQEVFEALRIPEGRRLDVPRAGVAEMEQETRASGRGQGSKRRRLAEFDKGRMPGTFKGPQAARARPEGCMLTPSAKLYAEMPDSAPLTSACYRRCTDVPTLSDHL